MWEPDNLQRVHDVEFQLCRDLTDEEYDYLQDYLTDDPMSTDTTYLIEVCGF